VDEPPSGRKDSSRGCNAMKSDSLYYTAPRPAMADAAPVAQDSQTDPFDLVVTRLRHQRCVVRPRSRDSVRAQCPAHHDVRPSLLVTRLEDRVVVKCFTGCEKSAVLRALGLKYADLYYTRKVLSAPVVIAEYDYCDLNGEIIAQKIRTNRKTFRWRTPDGNGWRSGLHGQSPQLYRWPDLVDLRQVVKAEGEKAVDRLWSLGIPATCGPSGASQWQDTWSEMLWRLGCQEIVILPDADVPGRRHARQVAESCYSHIGSPTRDEAEASAPWQGWPSATPTDAAMAPLRVKLVELPNLLTGADVVDYLEAHTASDLRQLIADAPYWYPGIEWEQRLARRRELTRRRVQRKRARDRAERDCNAANVRVTRTPLAFSPSPVCNAANVNQPVTRNAVTQCERTSLLITLSGTRSDATDAELNERIA
jgi:hypothetical protein